MGGPLTWVGYQFGSNPFVQKNFPMVIVAIVVISVLPMVFEYLRAADSGRIDRPDREYRSLVSQGFDGIEPRGLPGRIEAEHHADQTETATAAKIIGREAWMGQCIFQLTSSDAARPKRMPSAPPTRHNMTASTRNCRRMWWLRAPTAIRRPISRVRSVTETNMMFMMPTPPTTSEIIATTSSRALIVSVEEEKMR